MSKVYVLDSIYIYILKVGYRLYPTILFAFLIFSNRNYLPDMIYSYFNDAYNTI